MATYSVRFVHKISPKDTDIHDRLVEVSTADLENRRALAKVLREARVLGAGETLAIYRVEGDGGKIEVRGGHGPAECARWSGGALHWPMGKVDTIVAWPAGRSIWWSFILTLVE